MRISVIIPTLNESANIAAALASVADETDTEIIVVDGGSEDDTLAKCAAADHVLHAERGRANQLNAGAAAAGGDVLLFLHADCRLEAGGLDAIRKACAAENCVGGCFRQHIDAEGLRYRALEWGNAQRVRWLKMAYGDQGIFVKAKTFLRLGGFPPLRLMEDVYFMKRLRRAGRFVLLDQKIEISARRWRQRGVIRQTLTNWTLITAATLGVSPDRLASYYNNRR